MRRVPISVSHTAAGSFAVFRFGRYPAFGAGAGIVWTYFPSPSDWFAFSILALRATAWSGFAGIGASQPEPIRVLAAGLGEGFADFEVVLRLEELE